MKWTKCLSLLLVVSLVVGLMGMALGCTSKPEGPVNLGIPMGPETSSGYTQNVALSQLCKEHSDIVRVSPIATKGFEENGVYVLKGMAQLFGFSAQNAARIKAGEKPFDEWGGKDMSRILWLYSAPCLPFVTRADSGINTLADLKGHKVGFTSPGSTGQVIARRTLEGLGIDVDKDLEASYLTYADLTAGYKEGSLDVAVPVSGSASRPTSHVVDMFTSRDSKLIPVPPEVVNDANEKWGGKFLISVAIPAGTYKNQTEDVPTVAIAAFMGATPDLDKDIAYELCRLWWDYEDERNEISAHSENSNREDKIKILKDTPEFCPFHPGALKYYEEKGWLK